MQQEEFQKMDLIERAEYVNSLLAKEKEEPLRKVAEKLQLNYSSFCKEMRKGGYSFNQSRKQYEKTFSIEEYKEVEKYINKSGDANDVVQFIKDHFDELKVLLEVHSSQLVLNPIVYDANIETVTKTVQINSKVYSEFSDLCSKKFGHLRLRDVLSQCIYEFCERNKDKTPRL
ncbi:hypothetical protein H9655_11310 [Cytobacillus sp. Sa5YUA1]|uniref:Uncharacterized protein n=1 Tax=Cytobacillus stercorigallinarum TaxID=2762240 RepID=A0ABR8QQQ9_9BACI|nr:hypothetical protein [Cytobacillus stercorigallinarum]MBD7937612.1 hypothetical protein [Cytobacillus stercorigallinarum]